MGRRGYMDRGEWFQTFTGKKFYPKDPRPEDVCIEDIAHALAHINRFGGHLPEPWTVAQHSLVASSFAPPDLQLEALLHDAHEAYVGDMVKPLKLMMPEFQDVEDKVDTAIREAFGLPIRSLHPVVKKVDLIMLRTEAMQFVPERTGSWDEHLGVKPFPIDLIANREGAFGPNHVRARFLSEFELQEVAGGARTFRCWECGAWTEDARIFPLCSGCLSSGLGGG